MLNEYQITERIPENWFGSIRFDVLLMKNVFSNVIGTVQTNGEHGEDDDDSRVMNNLMSDIHSGFVQRRLPDGGFKVKLKLRLQDKKFGSFL